MEKNQGNQKSKREKERNVISDVILLALLREAADETPPKNKGQKRQNKETTAETKRPNTAHEPFNTLKTVLVGISRPRQMSLPTSIGGPWV